MSIDPSGFWRPPTTVSPSQLHAPIPPGHSYRDPVPPTTTLTPGELLEKFYTTERHNLDLMDPSGILETQMEVHLLHPENAAAPIGSPGLVGRWPRPNGLPAEPVPVEGVMMDDQQTVVEFRSSDPGCPSTGPALLDLFRWNEGVLKDATDVVMFGIKEFKFVISWPGYELQRFTVDVSGHHDGLLTRLELGRKIAVLYGVFFRDVTVEKMLPSKVDFYNIALHQGQDTRPGSLGVQVTQLHLVRLRGTMGGNWIAEIDIV